MSAAARSARRQVSYAALADILADARGLASVPYATVGKWSYAEILDHLASSIHMSFDGYGFRAAWLVRLAGPLFRNRVLHKPMQAGWKLPRQAAPLLPRPDVSVDDGLARLASGIARFDGETPTHAHPVLGPLSKEEYRLLHLRHAELHMSFVVPQPV